MALVSEIVQHSKSHKGFWYPPVGNLLWLSFIQNEEEMEGYTWGEHYSYTLLILAYEPPHPIKRS